MARIRQIKPEFYLDDELAQCSRDARLLFPGLWMLADRAGRLENRPAKIKAQVFPYDNDLDAAKIARLLGELEQHCFIFIYEVEDRSYIQIRTCEKHQHCHVNELASQIPEPKRDKPARKVRCKHRTSTLQTRCENDAGTVPAPEENGADPSTYTYTSTYTDIDTSGERHPEGGSAADAALAQTPEVLFEIYKAENKVLLEILDFTQERRKQCLTRLAKNPGKFIDQFTRAVLKAQETPFLRGEGSKGWRADFDWLISNDRNVVKVLEGKYDHHERGGPGSNGVSVFEKLRREQQEGGKHGSDRMA